MRRQLAERSDRSNVGMFLIGGVIALGMGVCRNLTQIQVDMAKLDGVHVAVLGHHVCGRMMPERMGAKES